MGTKFTPIVGRLAKIESRLEQVVHAIDQANQRQREQGDKPIAVAAVIRQPEAIERENTTNQHKAQRTQNIIAIAAWAAFVAALAYAVIAQLTLDKISEQTAQVYRQGDVDNENASKEDAQAFRQLQASQEQAKAAQDSVAAIQRQTRTAERAWIGITFPQTITVTEGAPIEVPVTFSNTGRTAARGVLAEAVVEIVPNGKNPAFDYRWDHKAFTTGIMLVNSPPLSLIAATYQHKKTTTGQATPHQVTHGEHEQYISGTVYFAIYARISYSDVFGIRHWTRGCFFVATVPATAQKCTNYADVDNN